MKPLLYLFVWIFLLNAQDIYNGKKPLYSDHFQLKEIVTIIDHDDNFYGSIDTYISEDNKVVILDRGNYRALIYNTQGEKVFEFGQEGHGPGEFSGTFDPIATKDCLMFLSAQKLMVFDYSGQLLSEIAGDFYNRIVVKPHQEYLQFYYIPGKGSALVSAQYAYDGTVIKKQERGFDDRPQYDRKDRKEWLENYENMYREKLAFFPFRNEFIRFDRLEYRLDVVDMFGRKIKSVYKDHRRIKYSQKDMYKVTAKERKENTPEQLEHLIKYYNRANQKLLSISDGYKSDINRISGSFKDKYLFVWTTTDKEDTIILDVFDQDYNYFSQIVLQEEGLNFCKIVNNKLITEYKSDEYGFYFKVFDILEPELDKNAVNSH